MVAHRTSPTNMGLALLANLAAHDFGYLPTGRLLERTARALRSMASLERYRGHFYNWYDTQTLQPLLPMYVSTVDSGNLAAHLLTLRVGLLALPDEPIVPRRVFEGLGRHAGRPRAIAGRRAPRRTHRNCGANSTSAIAAGVTTLGDARRRLDRLVVLAGELASDRWQRCASRRRPTAIAAAGLGPRAARPVPGRARRACSPCPVDVAGQPAGRARGPAAACPGTDAARNRGARGRVLPIIERELAADRDDATHAWLLRLRDAIAAGSALARQRNRHHRGPGPAGRRVRDPGLRLPVRHQSPPADDRLQRD